MTKYNVDMEDFDESRATGGYTGPEPTRGVYEGKLISVKDHISKEGNEGIEWCFEITKGEFKGWRGFQYSNMDGTLWKTQQLCYAITRVKKNVTVDTDNDGEKMIKKAKPIALRVRSEKFDGDRKAKLGAVLVALDSSEDDEDKEDPFD